MNRRCIGLFVFVCALAAGCGSTPAGPSPIPLGMWGGDHVTMTVGASATHLEFDCAHGDIPGALTIDGRGRFAVSGTYTRETGGPIGVGTPPDVHPATYSGSVVATTMQLTVTLTDTNQAIGSFTLVYGSAGRVVKCLLPLITRVS